MAAVFDRRPCVCMFYRGQTPADAEFSYLETAKRLEMYGVDLHSARVRVRISLLSLRLSTCITTYQRPYLHSSVCLPASLPTYPHHRPYLHHIHTGVHLPVPTSVAIVPCFPVLCSKAAYKTCTNSATFCRQTDTHTHGIRSDSIDRRTLCHD